MGIDGTLLIQVINFGIAYVIIRKLLLAPSIYALNDDAAHEREVLKRIEIQSSANNAREEHLKEQWHEYRQEVADKIPTADRFLGRFIYEKKPAVPVQEPTVDPAYVQELAHIVARDIVNKVSHVHK